MGNVSIAGAFWAAAARTLLMALLSGMLMALIDASPAHATTVALDRSFGASGVLKTGSGGALSVTGLYRDGSGNLLLAYTDGGTVVERYTADGTRRGTPARIANLHATAAALAGDGSLIVAGHPTGAAGADAYRHRAIRVRADGSSDAGFAARAATALAAAGVRDVYDSIDGVAAAANGRIVIAASANGINFVVRLLPDGSLDTGFGRGGYSWATGLVTSSGALLVDGSGRILVGGGVCFPFRATCSDGSFGIRRLRADGLNDTTFGSNGLATARPMTTTTTGPFVSRLAWGPNGTVVAAGMAEGLIAPQVAVARFSGSGQLDASFSGDGHLAKRVDGSSWTAAVRALVVAPNGDVIVGGMARSGTYTGYHDRFIWRISASGTVDESFPSAVGAALPAHPYQSIDAVLRQPDGRLVVAEMFGRLYYNDPSGDHRKRQVSLTRIVVGDSAASGPLAASYKGWATVTGAGTRPIWLWTSTAWKPTTIAAGTRVYAWPFAEGWHWAWHQNAWHAMRSGDLRAG